MDFKTNNSWLDSSSCMDLSAKVKHIPVLFNEVLSFFEPREQGRYIDGTLGMGGHAEGLLLKAHNGEVDIQLLGLDRDISALEFASERLSPYKDQVRIVHSAFADFEYILDDLGWEKIDGALIDIGVSSMQIDSAERGFSFYADGPLDMRMDRTCGQSAATFVNKASVTRLKEIIQSYGEDPMAGRIARAIEQARSRKALETTKELADVIMQAYPAKWRAKSRNHPATRTFQALRIAVNDELLQLESFLEKAVKRLSSGGRLAVITFHSLEDRIVKHFFRDQSTGCRCPRYISKCTCGRLPVVKVLTKKPISAGEEEVRKNSRATSAKLRVVEKL